MLPLSARWNERLIEQLIARCGSSPGAMHGCAPCVTFFVGTSRTILGMKDERSQFLHVDEPGEMAAARVFEWMLSGLPRSARAVLRSFRNAAGRPV